MHSCSQSGYLFEQIWTYVNHVSIILFSLYYVQYQFNFLNPLLVLALRPKVIPHRLPRKISVGKCRAVNVGYQRRCWQFWCLKKVPKGPKREHIFGFLENKLGKPYVAPLKHTHTPPPHLFPLSPPYESIIEAPPPRSLKEPSRTCLHLGHLPWWHLCGNLCSWWQSDGISHCRLHRGGLVFFSLPHGTVILATPQKHVTWLDNVHG